MILPSLQGAGSKFGARKCEGTVDWGVTVIDVDNKGAFDWTCDTVTFESQAAVAVKA